MRSLGVRLAAAAMSDVVDLFLCGVAVAVAVAVVRAARDVGWTASEGFGCDGVFMLGSGSSGRSGSPRSGEDAVCQLSSDFVETSGVVSRYSRGMG